MKTKIRDIVWSAPVREPIFKTDRLWLVSYVSNRTKNKWNGFGLVFKFFNTRREMRTFIKKLRKNEIKDAH